MNSVPESLPLVKNTDYVDVVDWSDDIYQFEEEKVWVELLLHFYYNIPNDKFSLDHKRKEDNEKKELEFEPSNEGCIKL